MLPFTSEALLALLEQYNRAIWPAQIAAYALALAAIAQTLRPVRGGDRAVGAALAAMWLWNALVFHLGHLATLHFLAPAFAAAFALEAALIAWTGAVRGRLALRFRATPAGWVGLALAVLALAVPPILGALDGRAWAQAPLAGVAPGPTTVLTLGLLLLVEGRPRWHLLAVPILWSLVGGAGAWLLAMPQGVSLLAAGAAAAGVAAWRRR